VPGDYRRILQSVELPAKSSVHINMQQAFTERGAELDTLKSRAFGGFFIRAESPTAKILVKEHIFSQSRQVASPYYGFAGPAINHQIIRQSPMDDGRANGHGGHLYLLQPLLF
jgi:hypothetical protein